jgi:hypothetical protein
MQFSFVIVVDFYIWGYMKAPVHADAHKQNRISSRNFGRCRWHSGVPHIPEDDLTISVVRLAEFCVRLAGGHPNSFYVMFQY